MLLGLKGGASGPQSQADDGSLVTDGAGNEGRGVATAGAIGDIWSLDAGENAASATSTRCLVE